jgi:YidC/Oxa1 family membrane protein insertase
MISSLFHTFVYVPLYNALMALLSVGGWVDVGVAIILLTLAVKFALFPLSLKASRTQRLMRELEAPTRDIKERYKDDREEQGRRLLALYREKGVNPFSSFAVLLIQLPVVLGLYFVFSRGDLATVDPSLLYAYVHPPDTVPMNLLGLLDLETRSYLLAFLAGLSQFVQAHTMMPPPAPRSETPSFQEDFARSLNLQMRYVLPVIVGFISYAIGSAVALYWITSNMFAIAQERYVKVRLERKS